MSGSTKLMTAGGGGVIVTPDASTASDVTVKLPTVGVNNGTVVCSDSSGNVGIGTSSPSYKLDIQGTDTSASIKATNTSGAATLRLVGVSSTSDNAVTQIVGAPESSGTNSYLGFQTRNSAGTIAERMRIDSSGNLLVGTTSAAIDSGVGIKLRYSATLPDICNVVNSSANYTTYHLYNINATNNGYRFYVGYNGGISNYSGNNTNLSDERTKTNIELSGDYLNKICSIPVKLFNYKDEPEGEQRTLGVIAQDVEAIAPELVNNEGFGATPDGKEPLKSVYTTDLMFAMMKAIQELKAELDATKAEVAALKGAA